MSTTKRQLRKVVGELSEDESRILLRFAEWLDEQRDELTEKELATLSRGEKQVRDGELVWWRDVKTSDV